MKNNRLIYMLLVILTIWCIFLTVVSFGEDKQTENNININEYNVNGFSTDLTKIVEEKKGSIVSISANSNVSTGFIYKQEGDTVYVLTCYHGIADVNSVYVCFESGFNINANVVGKNIYADLAVLSVNIPYDVEPLELGDASLVHSGEFIISIGTPTSLEYSNSVELGMISNNIRTIENNILVGEENIIYYLDVLQLSSNLKPGYSGSPVLNMNGDVIGMTTMSLDDRFNFAITANEIKIIADKIISNEQVKKYQLGIKGSYINEMPLFERTNLNLPVDVTYGLYVNKLMDNSIALTAGVKNSDIILTINGIKLNNINDYLAVVYSETDTLEFEVFRNGEIATFKVTIND